MPRSIPLALAAALAALWPAASLAQEPGATPSSTGLTATTSLAGGGELGLEDGDASVLELEATFGYELTSIGLRPEVGVAFGLSPDTHVGLRPGLRWSVRDLPVQLRVALDLSNARDTKLRWRWLLVGAAAEVRLTSVLGLYAEIDTGAPLGSEAGLPLLVRGGASFRL